jgi:hypothetical protein
MQHDDGVYGVILVNRHCSFKKESFEIIGNDGTMIVTPLSVSVFDRTGSIIYEHSIGKDEFDKMDMFDSYLDSRNDLNFRREHFKHHCGIVQTIEQIYKNNNIIGVV